MFSDLFLIGLARQEGQFHLGLGMREYPAVQPRSQFSTSQRDSILLLHYEQSGQELLAIIPNQLVCIEKVFKRQAREEAESSWFGDLFLLSSHTLRPSTPPHRERGQDRDLERESEIIQLGTSTPEQEGVGASTS